MTDEQHKELIAAIEGLGDKLTSNEIEWCQAVRTAAQIVGQVRVGVGGQEDALFKERILAAADIIYGCYGFGDRA